MKTSLDHLPEDKKTQVQELKDLILKKVPSADKIILFGSYASGNWVEDIYTEDGIRYEYVSDFDVLVVTTSRVEKEYILQDKIINSWRYHTPVNPIVHTIEYVNEGLGSGQYFFTDIVKEGIILFDAGKIFFSEPKILDPTKVKMLAQNNFNQWFENGCEFLIDASNAKERNSFNKVTFYLHQAMENFYSAVLLVFSGYKPKTHNLNILREYAKPYSKDLYCIFSPLSENDNENKLFAMLKKGYLEARYNSSFTIDIHSIEALHTRVEKASSIVRKICSERISNIR